jgi:hypothetical protein
MRMINSRVYHNAKLEFVIIARIKSLVKNPAKGGTPAIDKSVAETTMR